MNPGREGMRRGCTDTSPPERYTRYELSRVYDELYEAERRGGQEELQRVWDSKPRELKLEYTYSQWWYTNLEPGKVNA